MSETSVPDPQRLLFESCEEGDIGGIRAALAAGADINESRITEEFDGFEADSPLELAVQSRNPLAVDYLLKKGAKYQGQEAMLLEVAAGWRGEDVVSLLLEYFSGQPYDRSLIFSWAMAYRYFALADEMLKSGADVNFNYCEPLRVAVANRDLAVVVWLLENGADPLKCNADLLDAAIHSGEEGIMLALLRHPSCEGAWPEELSLNERLFWAAENGFAEVARYWVERGAEPNFQNGRPLRQAVRCRNSEVARYLLEETGADVDAMSGEPLLQAVNTGDSGMVRLLLENGADPSRNEWRALEIARNKGYPRIIKLLTEHKERVENSGKAIKRSWWRRRIPPA